MIEDLKSKRVFLRVDLNVPISDGHILVDHKLISIMPTIDYILNSGGKVILATHIGRPSSFDEKLSTKILLPWFKENGYKIDHESDLNTAKQKSMENYKTILLLENLRFNPEEKNSDEKFASLLSSLGDVYINDAFATLHREDTSVATLPSHFKQKSYGLLVESEIQALTKLKQDVKQPLTLVIGGNKVADKIKLIEQFITQKNPPKNILIGGAIAYTFLKSQGVSVGKSLVEERALSLAGEIINKSHSQGVNIVLPKDSLIKSDSKVVMVSNDHFPPDGVGCDIGQSTIDAFSRKIMDSRTVFTNGTMGVYSDPKYDNGSKIILSEIAKSNCFSIAGGGDVVAAIYKFKLSKKFSYLSTGGGATLKFLSIKSGDEFKEMPGLKALGVDHEENLASDDNTILR